MTSVGRWDISCLRESTDFLITEKNYLRLEVFLELEKSTLRNLPVITSQRKQKRYNKNILSAK